MVLCCEYTILIAHLTVSLALSLYLNITLAERLSQMTLYKIAANFPFTGCIFLHSSYYTLTYIYLFVEIPHSTAELT